MPSFVANDTFVAGGDGLDTSSQYGSSSLREAHDTPPSQVRPDLIERVKRSSMVLVTGPNYSGKSIYLKQVALIVFMAHIGRSVVTRTGMDLLSHVL